MRGRQTERGEVDARRAKDSQEDHRCRDPCRHREQPTEWLALGGRRTRALVAPRHEGIEAGEERRAGSRREDRARADRGRCDEADGERCAALAGDQQCGDHETLETDREVGREAHG